MAAITAYHPDEVSLLGEHESEISSIGRTPGDSIAGELFRTKLVDFELVTRSIVVAKVTSGLGHVDLERTWVLNEGIEVRAETNFVARFDFIDTRLAGKVLGAGIAAEVVA